MPKNHEPNLSDLLLLLRRNIIESVKKKGLKGDLTFSQIEILHFIGVAGEKTMKEIALYLKITPPSVTELVEEMERKNLVKRKNDQKDRRIVSVTLTERTKKHYLSIAQSKERLLNRMLSKLNQREKKELAKIINILNK
jgi:DNA-binding MarR family transcriptional regulator